jgi:hypothetical protein
MERATATAHLSGHVWRQTVIVAAMVSALVAAVVESRLEAPPIDPSCRELLAMPKWGWVCEDRRP